MSYRMKYHLMPPEGWMNDPNGLCQFHGIYHVFFQYSPYQVHGGMKYWGHYTSSDMLQWKYEGIALSPDIKEDRNGVYSGSAWIENDVMYLFYTGNVKLAGSYDYIDTGREAYQILVTSNDGIQMSEKTIILSPKDYPQGYTAHIRDPKIFKKNGKYYMVLGGRKRAEKNGARKDEGKILLYSSENLRQWEFCNEIGVEYDFGYMWECPDIFEVKNQPVLSFSPQGLKREKERYQNVYQSGYTFLEGEPEKGYKLGKFREWDYGFDFYAPQTFETEDGRRILIGWAGMPDSEEEYRNLTIEEGWQHCLTVPREIVLKNGILFQQPIRELMQLRKEHISLVKDRTQTVSQNTFEIEVKEIQGEECRICLGGKEETENYLEIFAAENKVRLLFKGTLGAGRTVRNAVAKEKVESIRILYDVSIVEVYVNNGEIVFTSRIYHDTEETSVKVSGNKEKSGLWLY